MDDLRKDALTLREISALPVMVGRSAQPMFTRF